ncbi:MAG: hypothetical protein A3K19_14440 [Lentisphaerae bacterium RIFOXYB12_FULL_65_16]|nr:MAG: hypothetical protein A3K18_18485 [Lentisphaerae bacterium RIFOXYA12_64_32]OGV87422.1 MAG: hypothetical protein A3K19_14440 [Lentisphaerae bacterium RIFOXYB12_FULL_65_16]
MLEVRNLKINLGAFSLRDVSLHVERGEYFVVLGPTGAGKTVLIECIAGLLRPDAGQVWIDGRDVTADAPESRRIGYLPQDYALFPHLTVRENLEFGLWAQRRLGEASAKVEWLSGLLGIGPLLGRYPHNLSGGEKQRVALGRALAIEPRLMLLDEPLSALDVATREQIGKEIRDIHDRTGITTVHISHDFEETLRLADRVALIRAGQVVQVGTPQDLFRRPASLFAARFVRAENLYSGVVPNGTAAVCVQTGGVDLRCETDLRGPVHVAIRADDVLVLSPDERPAHLNLIEGRIVRVQDRGAMVAVEVSGALDMTALLSRGDWRRLSPSAGAAVTLGFAPEAVHVFRDEEESGLCG